MSSSPIDTKPPRLRLRRPRFRPSEPAPFRLTDGDLAILHHLAAHRFLRSTHIAILVERSVDRTNDRLRKLYDARLVDRPRAQLDRFPDTGSAAMVYALADAGMGLIDADTRSGPVRDRTRRNVAAGRAYLDHHLAIADLSVALDRAVRLVPGVSLLRQPELAAEARQHGASGNPFRLTASLIGDTQAGAIVVPDLVFGLSLPDGSRRCFMVEIDRGTMPVRRSSGQQTSIDRKLRTYAGAHAAGQHRRQLGWKTFRVLFVVPDAQRRSAIAAALAELSLPGPLGAGLFLLHTRDLLVDPLAPLLPR